MGASLEIYNTTQANNRQRKQARLGCLSPAAFTLRYDKIYSLLDPVDAIFDSTYII